MFVNSIFLLVTSYFNYVQESKMYICNLLQEQTCEFRLKMANMFECFNTFPPHYLRGVIENILLTKTNVFCI